MFKKKEHYHKKSSFFPFVIFRFFLTLILLGVFGLGIYQAFKHFSGVDPGGVDPKKVVFTILAHEEVSKMMSQIFGENIPSFLDFKQNQALKDDLGDGTSEREEEFIENPSAEKILTFAVVADSHNDNENLTKALSQAKQSGAKFVIGVGDYSDVGTTQELEEAKKAFVSIGLPYYVTAGDHDLWKSRDQGIESDGLFRNVFGLPYRAFSDSNIRFVLVYNSDNYLGIDDLQKKWLQEELDLLEAGDYEQVFILLHEPLYHPSSDHVMGKTEPKIAIQAQDLINLFDKSGVGEIIAGDTHFYTKYEEPQTGLKMTTIGALTRDRNIQNPRFALVDVYSDGSYNIQDVEVK